MHKLTLNLHVTSACLCSLLFGLWLLVFSLAFVFGLWSLVFFFGLQLLVLGFWSLVLAFLFLVLGLRFRSSVFCAAFCLGLGMVHGKKTFLLLTLGS
jgi:hypothetical protein